MLFFLLIDGYEVNQRWFQPGQNTFMPIIFFIYIAIVYFVVLNIFIAVVLDVYATSEHNTRSDDVQKENPMMIFLKTYYNWMRGVSLVKDDTDEYLRSEDLAISLELLPGIVRRKWIEKKRNMQRVASENFAGMDLFGDPDIHKDDQTLTDWMLPSTRADVLAKMNNTHSEKPVPIYEVPATMLAQEVSRSQLQRLMDEDSTLPLLLGTPRAVDVIRRFKAVPDPSLTADGEADTFESMPPVKALQGSVFSKIDNLEKVQFDEEEVPHVPEVDAITEQMSHAVYDVRDQFRLQLTSIIEATAMLFEYLVELTQGIETVRVNHEGVLEMVRTSAMQDQYGGTSYSSASSPRY